MRGIHCALVFHTNFTFSGLETGICRHSLSPSPYASLLDHCGRIHGQRHTRTSEDHGHYRDVRFSNTGRAKQKCIVYQAGFVCIRTYVSKSTNPQTLMSLYALQMPFLFSRKQSRLTSLATPGCDNIRLHRKTRKFRNKPHLFHSCPGLDVLSDKTRIPVQDNEEPSQPRLYVTHHAPNVLICTPVGSIVLDNTFSDMSKGKIRKCSRVGTS